MFTGMSKSRRPLSTRIMTVMAVTDLLILAILEMEFYRMSQKMTFRMLLKPRCTCSITRLGQVCVWKLLRYESSTPTSREL